MKKLRCSSCGAELQVEDNKEYAFCSHCGSKYKLNEDLNVNIKLDDNVKNVINDGLKTFNHMSKFMLIPIGIFVIVFILIICFGFITANKNREKLESKSRTSEQQFNQFEEQLEEQLERTIKNTFNSKFSNYNGTKTAFFVESILDGIIQSNKIYDKKVILVFNGDETTTESEIINIKKSLKGNYEVSLNYDADGYINKVIIDVIK